jgi:RNA polymerase sigma-70 factor, ECF subfamily
VTFAPAAAPASLEDARIVAALRRGDERAFALLVDRYHASLVRLALGFVRDRAVAEEVAQETWLAVVKGIGRFEGRSSLKTWIFRILTNTAKTRGGREARTVPFSALAGTDEDGEPSVDPERFLEASHPQWPGHWASPPASWRELPEERLGARETLACARDAIAMLPEAQARVISLRDVEGWSAEEVCEVLGISEVNQRVLLHRARSKVRAALEVHLAD